MRAISSAAFAAGALATLLCVGFAAQAQDAPLPEASESDLTYSTGYDLWPLAQQLIDATRAEVAFAASHDTRFRAVQHLETGFTCAFTIGSQALVTVIAIDDLSRTGDDSLCIEAIEGTENSFRITNAPGKTIDDVFAEAAATAQGYLAGDILEVQAPPNLAVSPEQQDVDLTGLERRQVLLLGDGGEKGPSVLRIAVVRRPGDWYITQHYFAPVGDIPEDQHANFAALGGAVAEGLFAIRLGELLHPTIDPAFATGADGTIIEQGTP